MKIVAGPGCNSQLRDANSPPHASAKAAEALHLSIYLRLFREAPLAAADESALGTPGVNVCRRRGAGTGRGAGGTRGAGILPGAGQQAGQGLALRPSSGAQLQSGIQASTYLIAPFY